MPQQTPISPSIPQLDQFLDPGETVLVVEDLVDLSGLFYKFLSNQGLPVAIAASLAELDQQLLCHQPALILLDLGLPDGNALEVLNRLISEHPETAFIIITGSADLNTALTCLRLGADDYLVKPVNMQDFQHAVRCSLEKRRLTVDNRRYQQKLERSNLRARFLHQLNLQMNSAYLNRSGLDSILRAILTGITSGQGLGFNRAFLALITPDGQLLKGQLAVGPSSRAEAARVWAGIQEQNLQLDDILNHPESFSMNDDSRVNTIVHQLVIPTSDSDHLLIKTCQERISRRVTNGSCNNEPVPAELINLLDHDTFLAVSLYSPERSLGVILADNFVTGYPISDNDLFALEVFAGQASLAIEHCHLAETMRHKIQELEEVGNELEKNKDLLVAAERYSALGQMSAQLVHTLRNPVTTIGGISRMLARKFDDPEYTRFLKMITQETSKIEATLEDLFLFVDKQLPHKEYHTLQPLLRKCLLLFYNQMQKQGITYQLNLQEAPIQLLIDQRHIQQLLVHLIRNGIEAMSDGGQLTIGCSADNTTATITISDTGAGVFKGNLNKIGDPFFTTKVYGTGMGLSLVEKIATEHQGTFRLEHGSERGMTAVVTLPLSSPL